MPIPARFTVPRAEAPERSAHLRPRDGAEQRTTAVELFFDLIYVFAVTQLSHVVIDGRVSLSSVARGTFLLLVVWWAWIYTTWWVNWFDPLSGRVRLALTGACLVSLLMSAALPDAFGGHPALFAAAYVALQVGRNLCATLLLDRREPLRPVFERLVVWSCATGLLWIAGAFVPASARIAVWGPALAVELAAPLVGYRTPGLGRSSTSDWDVEGSHFADRFQAFIIIALGESIVVTGATASARGLSAQATGALGLAFLVTGALWWLYFGEAAENSQRHIAAAEDPGRLARDAYTYLHLPIVAGVIMVAVGDDFLITRPAAALSAGAVAMIVGGPALYLVGETLVRIRMINTASRKRLAGILGLAVLGLGGHELAAEILTGGVAAILVGLAVWESEPLQRRRAELWARFIYEKPW